jgi:HK97 gp10 family phage protein
MARDNGIDAVFRELGDIDKGLRTKIIRQAHRAGGKILKSEIQAEAPAATGRTRRSVKVRAGKRKKGFISTEVSIDGGHDEPFIGFVEFGTHDQAPQPFIRRSVAAKIHAVVDAIRAAIMAGIARGS